MTNALDIMNDVTNAELAVLGAALHSAGEILDELTLTGSDFTGTHNGRIYDTMLTLRAAGEPVEPTTLADRLPTLAAHITALTEHGRATSSAPFNASIVAKNALHQRLTDVGYGLQNLDPGMSSAEMTEYARKTIDDALGKQQARVRFIRDILPDLLAPAESNDLFVPTPWEALNTAIGGLRPGCLYVIGARPGVGKTVIAGQLAIALAARGTVAFSSLEMSDRELVARLVSERLNIPVGRFKENRITDRDRERIANNMGVVDLPIAIDDRAKVAPATVRAFARTVERHGKLAGVVVDYMQLMSVANTARRSRQEVVSEFSRDLKIMAKDLGVPVIALSQLNRDSESRLDGTPKLADLRESGAIEQDADCIILLTRRDSMAGEVITLDVAKNRHGETPVVELHWEGEFQRATEFGPAADIYTERATR
ncbi:replicative DNA helicase [Klugiella xanthotipulae]|uniref:DNA 5'-3' helicase n=1 Tax=Klugiella xanthotipulae TaxID=244735 RepID=A0A543I5G4_9MICO|nr:DnaB-like helicase C-terminal domain-containing protein [Klugiella xanthotipulae]TQM65819.1 replicative DNA helicase [Klugiella xanthotipulae]